MVTLPIPQNYTASPSEGTPQLTINRDATIDLDSSCAFEGPEKLLEVWFSPSPSSLPKSTAPNGLKNVSSDVWKEMLDLVNCKVLSIIESEHIDAYLLSESSMFVFPHKVILKTCGTTTLLYGLPRLLEIAALSAGFPHVAANPLKGKPAVATPHRVFYSRKNFLFPERQRGPHRSWRDEVRFLDKMFLGGSAYMVGKMNGDHWYLYLTSPGTSLTPPSTPDRENFHGYETPTKMLKLPNAMRAMQVNGSIIDDTNDETLEVLMTDLDQENAKQFYLENASAVAEGQYFERLRSKEEKVVDGMMDEQRLPGDGSAKYNGNDERLCDEGFDVFGHTSSDHVEFAAPGDEPYPEELTTEGHALGTVVSESCGLADVYPKSAYPDARVDAYLFTPCGFSANGVIPAPDGKGGSSSTHYFTVHVTPEPQCSYASFETNVPGLQTGRETAEIVEQVVSIFKPGRFSVTLFEAKATVAEEEYAISEGYAVKENRALAKRSARMENISGYRRVERIVHDLDGYDLVFRYYERDDWHGGSPRLGELSF